MSRLMKPGFWYLAGLGATALAVEMLRRTLQRQRDLAERGAFEPLPTATTTSRTGEAGAATNQSAPAAASKMMASTGPVPAKRITMPSVPRDDLTEIKGIGPVFARRLADAGITTFAALAKSPPDYLRDVTRATSVARPEDWIAQARLK